MFPNAAGPIAGNMGAQHAMGSSFLSSPLGQGAAYGLGSGLGSSLGGTTDGAQKRYQRRNYQYALRYTPELTKQNFLHTLEAARQGGVHPLAALGISPSGPISSGPSLPGQSGTGNFIGEGIKRAADVASGREAQAHARKIAGLQLEEQKLRNDYLAEQIAASRLKNQERVANSGARPATLAGPAPVIPGVTEAGPGVQDRGRIGTQTASLPTGASTSAEDYENRYGEQGGIFGGIVNTAYDAAGWNWDNDYVNAVINLALDKVYGYKKPPKKPRYRARMYDPYIPYSRGPHR